MLREGRVLKAIIAALGELPVDAVVTVGRINDPDRLDPAPSNVRVEQYVPQSHLLPRASAIVCHAGFSTVLGALGHGVPLVLLPMGADHFVNADCCKRLGVATVVDDVVNSDAIARATASLLADPNHRATAEVVRDELANLPGLDHAVELIERLANDNSHMPSSNIDLVRSIRAPWERGDWSSVEWADPEIELVFADGPDPGSWKGLAGMAEGWRAWAGAWEGFRAEAEEFRELDGERVLVLVHASGRGKKSGLELARIAEKGAELFHLQRGKVTRLVIYLDRQHALADIGLAPGTGSPAS